MERFRILIVLALLVPFSAHAGFLDTIVDTVRGHVDDVNGRLAADQFVHGTVEAEGKFRDDDIGQDTFHRGGGGVSLISNDMGLHVQLETSFWSTPGPDYHVYISATRGIEDEESFRNAEQVVNLGRLTKGSGASHYLVPPGFKVHSVTIWCKRFGEFIASADLR